MEELRDLQSIYNEASNRFIQYDGKDFVLPQTFKDQVKEINSSSIFYNDYSAIIETRGNQNGMLNIYLPNQWFYIASYFTDFYNELQKYKKEALKVVSKDRLKELDGQELSDSELARVGQLSLDEESKRRLIRFMTDYSWWNGAKTIDRGDFYVSPILNSAKLVNASQSFVADLCAFLSDKTDLIKEIMSVGDKPASSKRILIVNEKKLTLFILSTIKYFETKDHLNAIVPYAGSSSPIKVAKESEFSLTEMFIETTLEDIKVRNSTQQRWFENIFNLGERSVFLSTQWNAQGNYQLTLSDFLKMVRVCYGDNYLYKLGPNGEHQLYLIEKRIGDKTKMTSLQQIFYGAPGTGKSYEINRLTKGKDVIRTTFHPDSDYSTFVGAYKPTSVEVPVRDVTGKVIIENGQKVTENRIVYEFVEQAFLQAYINAWKAYKDAEAGTTPTEQYLVIEEINRGNCAQIFGDLFQLLDRNAAGFSDYPIKADKDMKKQLSKAFKDFVIADADRINSLYERDVVSEVINGDILLLPDNLFIWATMNTSDQSLFPIDSAFKRRWDWKYIPISEGVDESGKELNYAIKVRGKLYDWWDFVRKINDEIGDQTKSEDKKLGYFFCKAKDGVIDAETFVSKVVFYLWNDVFKDQDVANIFSDGEEELTFAKFYKTDTQGKAIVKEDKVEVLLKNLEVVEFASEDDDIITDDADPGSRRTLHVEFADETIAIIRFPEYLQVLRKIGLDKAEAVASEKQVNVLGCALVTKEPEDTIKQSQYSYVEADGYYVVKGIKGKVMLNFLPLISDRYNLNLKIEYR